MPLRLTAAPCVFTKLLVVLVAHLRSQGVVLHPYLDNVLIRSSSFSKGQQDLQLILDCLTWLGFLVNLDKSHTHPT